MSEQLELFQTERSDNDWREEWIGMPEYNNEQQPEPFITATFKFETQEDFDKFNELVKKHLYNGLKAFDGMQRKRVKTAWYPAKERASNYRCV